VHARLDDLLTATYALVDDLLPPRQGPGRPPKITDSELITLAVAQVLMGLPNDRQFLALAAGLWHNAEIGQPGRRLAAYGY
jgi:hypothetical protein